MNDMVGCFAIIFCEKKFENRISEVDIETVKCGFAN